MAEQMPCYVRVVPAWTDMGGRSEFFGPIPHSPSEPVFHERWESRVFGITMFVQTLLRPNLDAARFAMERLPREVYLSTYYRRWLGGLETKLVEDGYLDSADVDARLHGSRVEPGGRRVSRLRRAATSAALRRLLRPRLPRWLCAYVLPHITGTSRPALGRRRFSVGDPVRVRERSASGHTRQPGYVSGKPGVITAHHGATLFPDAHSVGRRARPQHLYTVAFEGRDLWGDRAEADTDVRVDLFEPYLEPA
jgi:nitrile hydratase subunit beta